MPTQKRSLSHLFRPHWVSPLVGTLLVHLLHPSTVQAQANQDSISTQPAVIGTGILLLLIVGTAAVVVILRLSSIMRGLNPPRQPVDIPAANPPPPPHGRTVR